MPPDMTRPAAARRPQRKITEEELKDIELKRIRGELSCAECRRLKLRCDKKVPCSSCCRRGCESICPCGILSAGQGTRFILADTEHLHRKISDMSHRIRQLEDALAILHATVSDERHPLLSDELLKIKFGPEAPHKAKQPKEDEIAAATKQSIDALGTLTLGDSGEVKYFGRSAGSETLMMAGEEDESCTDSEEEGPPVELNPSLAHLADLFPFTSKHRPNTDALEQLETLLPSYDRACALADSYLLHAAYFFRPVKREELTQQLIPAVYGAATARVQARVAAAEAASPKTDRHSTPGSASESSGSGTAATGEAAVDSTSPHALAMLFFVFALGALLDLNLPPYNTEAQHFYHLGRAALSLRSVFDYPMLETVQAIGLMATYHTLGSKKYSRDSAWCLMSLAAKLSQSIGLHRDSARWNMDPKTVQKRRTLFWEVFAADVSHSLALGRPPAINIDYVDCEFPTDEEAGLSDSGDILNGFWQMKYTFSRDMFLTVIETTLIAKTLSYGTVLNVDRKVREISFPTSFKPYVLREDGEQEYFSSSLSLQGFYASQHRTVTMLYLHRSYFAQAMLDHPTNPLLSPFAPSFLTAYRCASVIIKASAHQFDRCAEMAMRVWFMMYHVFSAAVIVGTVVTRSPNSNIASAALLDLGRAVELFERTAVQSQRARIALGLLRKLKERAVRSYTQYYSSTLPAQVTGVSGTLAHSAANDNNANGASPPASVTPQMPRDDFDHELAIFGGQTRVLARKSRCKQSPVTDSPSPPSVGGSSGSGGSGGSSAGVGSTSPSQLDGDIAQALSVSSPSNINVMAVADVDPALAPYLDPISVNGTSMSNVSPPLAPHYQHHHPESLALPASAASSSNPVSPPNIRGAGMPLSFHHSAAAPNHDIPSFSSSSSSSNANINTAGGMSFASSHPSGKQVGEIYSSFMDYLANRTLSKMTAPPLTIPGQAIPSGGSNSVFHSASTLVGAGARPAGAQSGWHAQQDETGLPRVDTSFGWSLPSDRTQAARHREDNDNDNAMAGVYLTGSAHSATLTPSTTTSPTAGAAMSGPMALPRESNSNVTSPPAFNMTPGPFVYNGYDPFAGAEQPGLHASSSGAPGASGLVLGMGDFGFLTESDADTRWFSFMQNSFGIMGGSVPDFSS